MCGEYAFGITGRYTDLVLLIFFVGFLITAVANIVIIILVTVILVRMSRNLLSSDHKLFVEQKSR